MQTPQRELPNSPAPTLEARYRVLLDQIPAVVFMAYLDQGIGEAYVSPQIEATLGFSQEEWLEDPVRWYRQIHPDDKDRWSTEAAEMFLSGKPLRSCVSGDGARRPGGLVSLRSPAGAARGRRALVHSRRRLRHHRTQAGAGSTAGRAQLRFGDFRYRGRADDGAGPGRPHRSLQSGLRADDRLFGRGIAGQVRLGLFVVPEEAGEFKNLFLADSRQCGAHRIREPLGDARGQAENHRLVGGGFAGHQTDTDLYHRFRNRCDGAEARARRNSGGCWKPRPMLSWW